MKNAPCILCRIVDELCAPKDQKLEAFARAAFLSRHLCSRAPEKLATADYLDGPLSMIGVLLTDVPELVDTSHTLLTTTIRITHDTKLAACSLDMLAMLEQTPPYAAFRNTLKDEEAPLAALPSRRCYWPTQATVQQVAFVLREPALEKVRDLIRSYRAATLLNKTGPA